MRVLPFVLAFAATAFPPYTGPAAEACPFCTPTGQTLAGEVANADLILYGTMSNAVRDPADAFNKGTTDMKIELVVKSHDMLGGKKAGDTISVPRYLPPGSKPVKYLVFFNVLDGKLDPYRGVESPADSDLPQYLKGAIEVRGKDPLTRLGYFFKYLEAQDLEISGDAYSEFGYAEYKDVRPLAEKLDPALLVKWLEDKNTRPSRFGLYGLLLGHCGKAEHAKAVRSLLDDPDRAYTSGLDGVLAGYVMLDPKAGWDYMIDRVKKPKGDHHFPQQYAALKAVRFFWDERPDVIPKKQLLEGMKVLMDQPDLADMPIENLRKWGVWEMTPTVLAYMKSEKHAAQGLCTRAILRFALSAAPHNAEAAAFVAEMRMKDPQRVKFAEALISDEKKPGP